MKVLIISNAFPNSGEETRGIFTFQIVKALQKKCDVEVIAPLPWIPPFRKTATISRYPHTNVPQKEDIGNITVHHPRYLVIPKILGFMHAAFMFFPLLKLVKELDRHDKIDLINVHWIFPDGVAAAWIGKKLHKPVILTALGCDINLYPTMMLRRIQISRALKTADYITTVSSDLKDRIVSLNIPVKKVKVISNGVDLDLFQIMNKKEVRTKLGIPTDRAVILTVGSQDEVKGTKYLIEAFHMMSMKMESPPLLLCIGDGPLRLSLVSRVNHFGGGNDILFLGRKPHSDIPLWMNAADLFCLPSLREGYPNVVLEALACGIPVVASDVGAIPEIIDDSNGRTCRKGDPRDLSRQLIEALKTSWIRGTIREAVKDNDWEHCANGYYKMYRKILR